MVIAMMFIGFKRLLVVMSYGQSLKMAMNKHVIMVELIVEWYWYKQNLY